jgi:hypothetical protein
MLAGCAPGTANIQPVISPESDSALSTADVYYTCRDRALLMLNDAVSRYLTLPRWKSGDRPQVSQEVNHAFDYLSHCERLLAATLINEETKRKLEPKY